MIRKKIFDEKHAPQARFVIKKHVPQARFIIQNAPKAGFFDSVLMNSLSY